MSKRKPDPTITDTLRREMAESGKSFRELSRETGVVRQSLVKFARGEQSLRLDHADMLATYFGLTLTRKDA